MLIEEQNGVLWKNKRIDKEIEEFGGPQSSENKRSDQAARQCWLQAREPVSTRQEGAKQRSSQSEN